MQEVDDVAEEQRPIAPDHAVEHAVDHVAERAREDEREAVAVGGRRAADRPQVRENPERGDDREEAQEGLAAQRQPEGHARVFGKREPEQPTDHRDRLSGVHRELHDDLGDLVGDEDEGGEPEDAHRGRPVASGMGPVAG